MGSVAKSYMTKGFLIYEEMLKYLVIYEEAISHIRLCNCTSLNFLKVHKHENFFWTFFAETETLWSQGPVTRDF